MNYLFKLWNDIVLHNNELDKIIIRHLIVRVREIISHDDAVALEYHFKRIPIDYRHDVSEVFLFHALILLEGSNRDWTKENITAIRNLLHEDSLNWGKEEVIQSLEDERRKRVVHTMDEEYNRKHPDANRPIELGKLED
jgi:hypothetical protein